MLSIDRSATDDENCATLRQIHDARGQDPDVESFRLTPRDTARARDEIALTGRSVLCALFFLSHDVDPGAEHQSMGFVANAQGGRQGNTLSESSGGLIKIPSSASV